MSPVRKVIFVRSQLLYIGNIVVSVKKGGQIRVVNN